MSDLSNDQLALQRTVAAWLDTVLINPVSREPGSEGGGASRVVPLRMFRSPATRNIGWIVLPPALTRTQQRMLASVLPSNILALTRGDQAPTGLEVVNTTLLVSNQARLRLHEVAVGPDDLLVGITASMKYVSLLVPAHGTGYVMKSSRLEANLRHEERVLKSLPSGYPAPRAIASGRSSTGVIHTVQTLVPGISLDIVKFDTDGKRQWLLRELGRLLKALGCPGERTSLAEQADAMREEIRSSEIDPVDSTALLRLLEPIVNTQPVTCSRVHGDFRRRNMQVGWVRDASGQAVPKIFLLDWEFSRRCGIGITDFIRFALESAYDQATTFAALLPVSTVRQIEKAIKGLGLDGHDLPPEDLLRLHVAMYSFDRIRSFPEAPRTLRLQAMIQTPWPEG